MILDSKGNELNIGDKVYCVLNTICFIEGVHTVHRFYDTNTEALTVRLDLNQIESGGGWGIGKETYGYWDLYPHNLVKLNIDN